MIRNRTIDKNWEYFEDKFNIDEKSFFLSTTIYKDENGQTERQYATLCPNDSNKQSEYYIKDADTIFFDKKNKIFQVRDRIFYEIAGVQKNTEIKFILDLNGNVMGDACYISALHKFLPFPTSKKNEYATFKKEVEEKITQEAYANLSQNPSPFTLSIEFIEDTDFCFVYCSCKNEQKVKLYNHKTEKDVTPYVKEITYDEFDQTFCAYDVIKIDEKEVVSLEFMLNITGEHVGELYINGQPYHTDENLMRNNYQKYLELKELLQVMYSAIPVEQIMKVLTATN